MAKQLTTEQRFDKIDAQLDKMATVIVNGFTEVNKALETKADEKDLRQIYDLLDKIANQQEIDNVERLVMGHQLDRLDQTPQLPGVFVCYTSLNEG
jgi:hypothetical protein